MSVERYDTGRGQDYECSSGRYVLHSDYATTEDERDKLAQEVMRLVNINEQLHESHNSLREAVAWERECCQDIRPLFAWSGLYLRHGEGYLDGVAEDLRAIQDAARAEVDRLIGGE